MYVIEVEVLVLILYYVHYVNYFGFTCAHKSEIYNSIGNIRMNMMRKGARKWFLPRIYIKTYM